MKRYKPLGAMLAAGFIVANAHAVSPPSLIPETVAGNLTVNLGYNPNVPNVYVVYHQNFGAFSDVFNFRFTEPGPNGDVSASYATLQLLDLHGISNVTFGLYNSNNVLVQAGCITPNGPTQSSGALTSPPLAYGSYYYKLAGDSVGSAGAAYQFSQIANPVPEPSTYALMLIGLLGLGYVAVRQARTAASRVDFGMAA